MLCTCVDRSSGCKHLLDLRAQVRVISASCKDKHPSSKSPVLQAVNESSISTFGTRVVPILIRDKCYTWDCVFEDVCQPLLGGDFMCTSDCMVDHKGYRLIDTTTYAITLLSRVAQVDPRISIVAIKADGHLVIYWESFLQ